MKVERIEVTKDRSIFSIDVGNMTVEEMENYIEQLAEEFKLRKTDES
jgi:hypothetical protein